MSYNDQLIERVVETYCAATQNTEFSRTDVAAWAIQNGHWKPSMKSQIELLSDELAVAMRAERKTIKGRKVRQYHCIRRKLESGYVQTVWAHIDVATDPFMEQSIALRRKGAANIVYQIHNDVVHWKEKNPNTTIEVLFDFRDDNADKDAALAAGQAVDDEELDIEVLGQEEKV